MLGIHGVGSVHEGMEGHESRTRTRIRKKKKKREWRVAARANESESEYGQHPVEAWRAKRGWSRSRVGGDGSACRSWYAVVFSFSLVSGSRGLRATPGSRGTLSLEQFNQGRLPSLGLSVRHLRLGNLTLTVNSPSDLPSWFDIQIRSDHTPWERGVTPCPG